MKEWTWSQEDFIPAGELEELAHECAQKMCQELGINTFQRSVVLGTVQQEVLKDHELIGSCPFSAFLPFSIPPSFANHERVMEVRKIGSENILISRGRVHFYETRDQRKATFMMWIMKAAKIAETILTQAAGALAPHFSVRDFVFLTGVFRYEHPDPFLGILPEKGKHFFKDPSQPFNKKLRNELVDIASKEHIPRQVGIVSLITGPTFEDDGQRLFLANYAHAAAMSTGNEGIVAKILGMKVQGISVMTDECKPGCEIIQADIEKVAHETQNPMNRLLTTYYENPLPIDR